MKGSEYELDNRHFHSKTSRIQTGHSWILLCLAVVLHVIDEATHNFLAVYNPTVMALRERVPRLPLPVFSFRMWITSLAIAVALGFSLSRFLLRGALWVRLIVCVYPY